MTKARLTVTYEMDIDLVAEHYPGCKSDLERMNADIANFQDPFMVAEMINGGSYHKTSITGVLLSSEVPA
ncbi:hypothetical protein ACODYM_28770 [Burkholderia gladioli]|uniref:hypothetical protein n=1 Tax=Burkholderia gladioli TaxID=28095 RepID=UPI003B5143F0